ncbi:MAG: PAAR domain-containing protein [Planctomycetaceae bacterium]|nr:PAAR domain-containing protein [Planctomycetaceae bacterium]
MMSHTTKRAVTSAEPTVLTEGQPAAVAGRVADIEQPLTSGEPTVLIAGHPAATSDGQTSGKPTVIIGGRPAADENAPFSHP